MKATFNSHDTRDFIQRYVGTYGYFELEGKPDLPVWIETVDGNTLYFSDFDGNKYHTYADQNVSFKFQQVRRSYYIGKSGNIYLLERVPARQYQRGVSRSNTRCYRYGNGNWNPIRVDHTSMADIMFGGTQCKHGIKLSETFALLDNVLWLYTSAIGVSDGATIQIMNGWTKFRQEVSDAIRDSKLNYKVV